MLTRATTELMSSTIKNWHRWLHNVTPHFALATAVACAMRRQFGRATWLCAVDIYRITSTVEVQERLQEHLAPGNKIHMQQN